MSDIPEDGITTMWVATEIHTLLADEDFTLDRNKVERLVVLSGFAVGLCFKFESMLRARGVEL